MFRTIRRINRKYKQFVNLGVTAILVIALGIFLANTQKAEVQSINDEYSRLHTLMVDRQDSILNEIDRLKVGIDAATAREYRIKRGADIIINTRKNIAEVDALKLAALIYDECERSGVSYAYALAIIHTESRFNHKVTSNVGAQGIMQIMPLTFVSIAKLHDYDYLESDITDLKKNIRIGTIYLHRLHSMYGNYSLASAGYNGGPRAAGNYKRLVAGDSTAQVPDETLSYVKSVSSTFSSYKKILGE